MPQKRLSVLLLFLVFSGSIASLFLVYSYFPDIDESEKNKLKLPTSIDDAKNLGQLLSRYTETYYLPVFGAVILTFVFLQSFAIPGSIFLSILSGFLFSFTEALVLVCVCSSIGASICYLLSSLLGRPLIMHYFPDKITKWSQQVENNKDDLFHYILFLRITPFLPNWFINVSSPMLDVPVWPFFWGTFFGVAPPSIIAIQTGQTLLTLTSDEEQFSLKKLAALLLLGFAALIPVGIKRYYRSRLRQKID